jgi:hypothetical protein
MSNKTKTNRTNQFQVTRERMQRASFSFLEVKVASSDSILRVPQQFSHFLLTGRVGLRRESLPFEEQINEILFRNVLVHVCTHRYMN